MIPLIVVRLFVLNWRSIVAFFLLSLSAPAANEDLAAASQRIRMDIKILAALRKNLPEINRLTDTALSAAKKTKGPPAQFMHFISLMHLASIGAAQSTPFKPGLMKAKWDEALRFESWKKGTYDLWTGKDKAVLDVLKISTPPFEWALLLARYFDLIPDAKRHFFGKGFLVYHCESLAQWGQLVASEKCFDKMDLGASITARDPGYERRALAVRVDSWWQLRRADRFEAQAKKLAASGHLQEAKMLTAQALLLQGKNDLSLRQMQEIRGQVSDPLFAKSVDAGISYAYASLGQFSKAEDLLKLVIKNHGPKESKLVLMRHQFQLAKLYVRNHKWLEALELLKAIPAFSNNPDHDLALQSEALKCLVRRVSTRRPIDACARLSTEYNSRLRSFPGTEWYSFMLMDLMKMVATKRLSAQDRKNLAGFSRKIRKDAPPGDPTSLLIAAIEANP